MIPILDPSSAPVHIHVSSSDQVMQRLSQQSRFNNNRVIVIVGGISLCTFRISMSYSYLQMKQIEASTRN